MISMTSISPIGVTGVTMTGSFRGAVRRLGAGARRVVDRVVDREAAAFRGEATLRRAVRRRGSRAGASRDLTRLLGQPVDALEDAVDVRSRARLLGLRLELLDRGADGLVGVLQPSLDLAADVGRDSLLRLAQRPPAGADGAPDDARTPARTLPCCHALPPQRCRAAR